MTTEGTDMAGKRSTPEQIVAKLRQVEVLTAQGRPVAEAVRAIGISEPRYYRWRAGYGGVKLEQGEGVKQLGGGKARLRKGGGGPTLEEVGLKEAAAGN